MRDDRPSTRQRFPRVIARLIALTLTFSPLLLADSGWCVPHTVSTRHHPYDPDWPDVAQILRKKCAGCHRGKTERYDLSSYDALLAAGRDEDAPAVVPHSPSESLLWEYVNWNASGGDATQIPDSPMMPPKKHDWLTAGQLATVKRWIENGARELVVPSGKARPLFELEFPSAHECKSCHPRQYDQWSRSMHAYAQHSPIFEAFNLTLIERTSGTIGTFCSRCHTPLGTAMGENGSLRNIHRARLSMEGVTCIVCHRRGRGHYKSSGRVEITPGDLKTACLYGPFESQASAHHDSHGSQKQPYLSSSQFCGECHDVTSPQGIRLEEAFSEWNHSPAAKQRINCQQCHMGPIQGKAVPKCHWPLGRAAVLPGVPPEELPLRRLSDHTFPGPDYSLLPDTEFPEKLDWMYEVDYRDPSTLTAYQQRTLGELRLSNRRSLEIYRAKRAELLRNSGRLHLSVPQQTRGGSVLPIEVAIESTTAGHNFPTGFTAERQVWISVELRDPWGNLVFQSGDLDANGDLRDDHSHAVLTGHAPHDRHLMNLQNKFVALTNKGTERSVVISVNRSFRPVNIVRPADDLANIFGRPAGFRLAKASLRPLATVTKTYPAKLPDVAGTFHLRVRLNFRHLPPTLLDHIGTPHLKHQLETFVIAECERQITVSR